MVADDGFEFRDLNKNGRLDPYEDPRLPVEERVADLLSQMTVAEKAGLMFHTMMTMNDDGTLMEEPSPFSPIGTTSLVGEMKLNHFNMLRASGPKAMAEWHNRIQTLAESTRLGIPITVSSDPRHAYTENPGASFFASFFSQWPEPIGLGAIGDADLVEQFADIARQEYTAVGIRVALHPMADLATEPRWARMNGTFGEDADLSAKLTAAYIRGFQGSDLAPGTLGPQSVACMTKHFPGGGPQMDGEDAHFAIGKEQVYPGDNFDYHLIPFKAAFEAGTAQIMPYYGMPIDTKLGGDELEPVGFGFNKQVITGLLREKYGFDGVVCTDWKLLTDSKMGDRIMVEAKAWGVEELTVAERAQKALDAGVDQFGGEACPDIVIGLVESGQLSEARLDESARRILRDKFRLGLFDNPYIDVAQVEAVIGNPSFVEAGALAQRKSLVLLKNGDQNSGAVLPLSGKPKIYIENMNAEVAAAYGKVVESPAEADFAILRLSTPFEPREGFLEAHFHSGDLDFKGEEKERILRILGTVPTIVDIYLERAAVIPEIAEECVALIGNFGASDEAGLDLAFGHFRPVGKLPFELPSSMDAVRNQKEDLPYDSVKPLFAFGHGLTLGSD